MHTSGEVRPLAVRDVPAIAALHCRAFSDSAMSALGPPIVRPYYRWLLLGPHRTYLIGYFAGDELAGFCACGVFNGAVSGFLRKNWGRILLRTATQPWLLCGPFFRRRVLLGLRILRKHSPSRRGVAPAAKGPRPFTILAVAVDPQRRDQGIGRILMTEAESCARRQAHTRMTLTVHTSNEPALRLYERCGWSKVTGPGGVWEGSMEKRIGD